MSRNNLTDELKRLIGTGATPKHCLSKPTLCELAGAGDASSTARGYLARDYLRGSIGSVEGPVWFEGRELAAEQLKRALYVLLGLERSSFSAPARRQWVIEHLGLHCSVETFRRPIGPERELCWILAGQMVAIAKTKAA